MLDIIISTLLAICTLRLGYLGMHPPTSDTDRSAYKWQFIILGGVSIVLIILQGVQTNISQQEFRQAQGQLQLAFDVERKEANAARSELNVAHDELKELKAQTETLRSDLAIESARRDQAQRDMALIIKKTSA